MKQKIIDLFDALCLPYKEGKGQKEAQIIKEIKNIGLEPIYEKEVGIIAPAKENDKKIVIISHMDLIPLFNKGFKKGNKFEIKEDEWLIGALDNTITNAVAIAIMEEVSEYNIEFIFTEAEETTMNGIRNYMKKFHKENNFYINLDVTNDNWKYTHSIEYDKPNHNILKQCYELGFQGITDDRVCDDLDVVNMFGGYGFSYCLPTKKTIHSYKNKTKLNKLEPYAQGLINLIKNLDIEDIKSNIDRYMLFSKKPMEIAKMSIEEFETYKKEIENQKPIYSYNINSCSSQSTQRTLFEYTYDDEDNEEEFAFITEYLDYIYDVLNSEFGLELEDDIIDFISYCVMNQIPFNIEEFEENITIETIENFASNIGFKALMDQYNLSVLEAFIKLGLNHKFISEQEPGLFWFDINLYYEEVEGLY